MELHGDEEGRERDERECGWKGSEGGLPVLYCPSRDGRIFYPLSRAEAYQRGVRGTNNTPVGWGGEKI